MCANECLCNFYERIVSASVACECECASIKYAWARVFNVCKCAYVFVPGFICGIYVSMCPYIYSYMVVQFLHKIMGGYVTDILIGGYCTNEAKQRTGKGWPKHGHGPLM